VGRPDRRSTASSVAVHAIVAEMLSGASESPLFGFLSLQRLPTEPSYAFRLPALMAIPLRRSLRPCGFLEPLLLHGKFASSAFHDRGPLSVMRRRPLSRQRSATFVAITGLVDSDRFRNWTSRHRIQQRSWDFFPSQL